MPASFHKLCTYARVEKATPFTGLFHRIKSFRIATAHLLYYTLKEFTYWIWNLYCSDN